MSGENLKIGESVLKGKIVLTLAGDIDAQTAHLLKESLERSALSGKAGVILDFTGVKYISSAGIGVLNAALALMKSKGGSLVLAGVGKVVRDTLEVMYFTRKVRLFDSVDLAAQEM